MERQLHGIGKIISRIERRVSCWMYH